jgi:exoribonuclease R
MMNYPDRFYQQTIEPLYGKQRDTVLDATLLKNNLMAHKYNINKRTNMTKYATYSIDPAGCEDADDAFSIYTEDDKLYLAIHIADPTEYINPDSLLWKDIENRIVTRYPSNKKPIHMIPEEIMERSSLMVNKYGKQKLAITILTEIQKETYKPIGNVRLLFTKIVVNAENALSYEKAGNMFETNDVLQNGIKISKALTEIRSGKTKGVVLNEVSNSCVKYDEDRLYLCRDSPTDKLMKQMIAEFAIFANSFVGEYLKINFEGVGIFRICSASEWLSTVYSGITGQELLNEIIVNGIQAEYISSVKSHDLVGSPEYCHFTSPIRRLSDCVCHYLLKYIHLKPISPDMPIPFDNTQLEIYSNKCMQITKSIKNIQYKDTKHRLLQTMNGMLLTSPALTIKYYVSSYVKSFLNIIICNINDHTVYLSYTLRIPDLQTEYVVKQVKTLEVTRVNYTNKFDEGSIPELDILYIT